MAKSNAPSALEREQIIGMMEKEMEYRVDMFNKLTHTCFNKCIEHKYKESELNMGENSCIDRCVSKYWQQFYGALRGAIRRAHILTWHATCGKKIWWRATWR
ncbi:protein transporter tim10 [Orobanche gracilis]